MENVNFYDKIKNFNVHSLSSIKGKKRKVQVEFILMYLRFIFIEFYCFNEDRISNDNLIDYLITLNAQ